MGTRDTTYSADVRLGPARYYGDTRFRIREDAVEMTAPRVSVETYVRLWVSRRATAALGILFTLAVGYSFVTTSDGVLPGWSGYAFLAALACFALAWLLGHPFWLPREVETIVLVPGQVSDVRLVDRDSRVLTVLLFGVLGLLLGRKTRRIGLTIRLDEGERAMVVEPDGVEDFAQIAAAVQRLAS